MPQKTEQRLLCEAYCRQYKSLKDLTLARRIYKENVGMFKNAEHARDFVRRIRGHHSEKKRAAAIDKSLFTPLNYDTTNQIMYKEQISTTAKVLVLDIETAPLLSYTWGIWNQNVSTNQIASDWFMLTWAAKWLFEDKVYSGKLTPKEAKKQDDKRITKGIWQLINEADLVIAHNCNRFDIPKLNSRFIINGLQPPLPYQTIDTLVHIRRQFGFTSNKLEYVQKLLSLPRKTDTGGMGLWIRCMQGEQAALDEMEAYNINDVRILEETYLHIRAWIKPHPNMGLFILDEQQARCPSCGSDKLLTQGKSYYTSVNAYELYRCDNCGATGRKRTANITTKQRQHLITSTT